MQTFPNRLLAVLTVLLTLLLLAPSLAAADGTTTSGSYPTAGPVSTFYPKNYHEIVIQVDSSIPEVKNYADWFLGQLNITESNYKSKRIHHIYETAIHGFSVYLTSYEYERATNLNLPGLTSLTLSTWGEITVGPITQVEGKMPPFPMAPNKEVVPFNIQRAGMDSTSFTGVGGVDDFSGIDVAVIDTGVDRFHPDLNVVGGYDCVAAPGDMPDFAYDGYGHGTHVAGTIAARVNGVGVVGGAPNARIWSYKVLDSNGSGSWASVLCGIDKAAENATIIDVANMSLGGNGMKSACGGDDPMHDAVCALTDLGVIVVVAAGNSSADAVGHVPANYAEVVTVSAFADFDGQAGGGAIAPQDRCYAMSVDDELAAYSNYGADIDISAPGTCVLSTLPGEKDVDGNYVPKWGYASGTSMAAPMMTSCVAKYLAANPDQKEYAVQQIITYSDARSEPVKGDHDGLHEPLLFCDAVPRYEGSQESYNGT